MQPESQERELVALRRQLAEQAEELERLRSGGRPSRRALLTGGAAVAGGMVALSGANARPAHAVDGHDILYPDSGDTAHLFLKANGTAIPGENTRAGREGSIECFYFQQKARTVVNKRGVSKVKLDDIVIRKPVDKASPRLAEAHETQARLSGEFQFFRMDKTGTPNHFFTVAFTGGRVRWRDIYLPDLAAAAGAGRYGVPAPYEEIGLRLSRLRWTHEDGDISFGG